MARLVRAGVRWDVRWDQVNDQAAAADLIQSKRWRCSVDGLPETWYN
jgi:hypothetical protein